jgi:predicted nuclease of restriction endonuclease-like RecB superfamily
VLTKDLLRCRAERGQLRPRFVAPTDAALLALAEQLLAVYRLEQQPTRGELDEALAPLLGGAREPILAKGLNKLLQDRADFTQPGELDYPALRARLFAASARLLAQPGELTPESLTAQARAAAALPPEFVAGGPYADLPEGERLVTFRDLSAAQLLERYNLALVQSLLLRAETLRVTVADPEPAHLRRLLKYLRFFRLLAHLARPADRPDALLLTIDGPASLFDNGRKYGLQLASFFPAVCQLPQWRLETEVEWQGRRRPLVLDQQTGLVCPYRNLGAYVPEEIRLFHQHFKETVADWQIVGDTPFLDAGGQALVFPDLSFRHPDGTLVHLELFHRWHAAPLQQRLPWLATRPRTPLILGVDRALAEQTAVAALLEAHPWFAERGFLFKDYPTVTKARACLEAWRAARR